MIGLMLAVLTLLLVLFIATRPSHFHVARSATIDAPPSAVFSYLNDLRRFQDWSPFAKADPNGTVTFEGPETGKGAAFRWAGGRSGAGRMEIVESLTDERVISRLDFYKPFKATNTGSFVITPEGTGTRMTWSMEGRNNFMGKAMGLVMNCDKMLGGLFEQGLANLKEIAERGQ